MQDGVVCAERFGMVARCFEELIAWQLAFELEKEVFAFTATGAPWRDVKYREQIRDAISSASRNTAEGFGRFRPKEFIRFLEFAHGSLDETKNCLHEARSRRYIDSNLHRRLITLNVRALAANAGLQKYLRTCDPRNPFRRDDDAPEEPSNLSEP